MSGIEKFDFAGLSERHLRVDPEHGPLMQASAFIRWAGWTSPSNVVQTHLEEGDVVMVKVREEGVNGALPMYERYLNTRGARRLLFRSKNPLAIEYTDRVLDLMAMVDKAQRVGIDVVHALERKVDELEGRTELYEVAEEGYRVLRAKAQAEAWNEGLKAGRYSSRFDRTIANPYNEDVLKLLPKFVEAEEDWAIELQEELTED